jgi:Cu-Zn family superoxide dismutase
VVVTPPVWTGSPAPAGDDHGSDGHGAAEDHGASHSSGGVTATIVLPNGTEIGEALFVDQEVARIVSVHIDEGSTLAPGFHGMHLHDIGVCEPNSVAPTGGEPGNFLSAGGHWQVGGAHTHGNGTGDLPALLVAEDGSATMSFATDKFTIDELTEGDSTALMIHVGPDNYGNIPDRYTLPDNAPVPDAQTLATGDAGGRAACGEVIAAE